MITATLSAVVAFLAKVLSLAIGVVVFVVPIVLKIAFGIFIMISSLATIWMILVGLTIFLAPSGGVRKHMDISYPDPEDITPWSQSTKDRITLDEFVLTLALPKTYLPTLLKETGVAIGKFTVDSSITFVTDLGNLMMRAGVGPLNKARATRLGAAIWPLPKTDEDITPIGYRPSW